MIKRYQHQQGKPVVENQSTFRIPIAYAASSDWLFQKLKKNSTNQSANNFLKRYAGTRKVNLTTGIATLEDSADFSKFSNYRSKFCRHRYRKRAISFKQKIESQIAVLLETQAAVGQNNIFPCKLDSTFLNSFSSFKTIQNKTVHCGTCY